MDFAHNELLQLAAEVGALGTGIVLLGLVAVMFWTVKALRSELPAVVRLDLIGTTLALSLPIVHSFLDFPLHLPALAFLLAVCLALHLRMLHWIELSRGSFPQARSRQRLMMDQLVASGK